MASLVYHTEPKLKIWEKKNYKQTDVAQKKLTAW